MQIKLSFQISAVSLFLFLLFSMIPVMDEAYYWADKEEIKNQEDYHKNVPVFSHTVKSDSVVLSHTSRYFPAIDYSNESILGIGITVENSFDYYCYTDHMLSLWAYGVPFNTHSSTTPILSDINNDGVKEFIFGTDGGALFVCSPYQSLFRRLPYNFNGGISNTIAIEDINNDTIPEIVFTTEKNYVYAIYCNGRVLEGWPKQLNSTITQPVVLADITNDGIPDIIVASDDGIIYSWSFDGRSIFGWPYNLRDPITRPLAVGDINNDNSLEIIAISNNKIYLLTKHGSVLEYWPKVLNDGDYLAPIITDVNFDGNLELLILSQDGDFYVFDYLGKMLDYFSTEINEPLINNPVLINIGLKQFGLAVSSEHKVYFIKIAKHETVIISENEESTVVGYQMTQDCKLIILWSNILEILCLNYDNQLSVMWLSEHGNSANTRMFLTTLEFPFLYPWPYKLENSDCVCSINVVDINKDNQNEVIIGRFGRVDILSENGHLISSKECNSTYGYISNICIDDLDGDSVTEIVGTNNAELFVWKFNNTIQEEWLYNTFGNITSLLIADLNNDSLKEVIVATENEVIVKDSQGFTINNWPQNVSGLISHISVIDLDKDNMSEVIVGTSESLYIFFNNGTLVQGWPREDISSVLTFTFTDVNNDTFMDIIALNNSHILCIDYYGNQFLNWPKAQMEWNIASGILRIADINKNGENEIIVFTEKTLTIYNLEGDMLDQVDGLSGSDIGFMDLAISNIDSDKNFEIIIASNQGIKYYDYKITLEEHVITSMTVDNLIICDLNRNNRTDLIYSTENQIYVLQTNGCGLFLYPTVDNNYQRTGIICDSDLDGLIDVDEKILNSNPTNNDTDGDGLDDYTELFYNSSPLLNDTDRDGLDDFKEVVYKTNPLNNDTDNDGLDDYSELFIYQTSPLLYDTDGDTIPDFYEVYVYNTEPANIDTDDDKLPDEWEIFYGFNPLSGDDANIDVDGDDLTNLLEFTFHTSPLNNDTDNDGLDDKWEVYTGTNPLFNDSKEDLDMDGLTNHQEYLLGTFANNTDSDIDGMPDKWEVINNLNPLYYDRNEDPDADLLLNVEEFRFSTDPHNNDTDSDYMPDGWEVKYNLNPLSNDASKDKDNDGLSNYEELLLGTNPIDYDTDSDYMPDGYEVFYGLDPTTDDANGDLDNDGLINYSEYNLGSDPTNNDSDGDTLLDGEEYYIYHTNVNKADSDSDGLIDSEEIKIYNTDPLNEDTDGDGVSDLLEIQQGTDPLNFYSNLKNRIFFSRLLLSLVIMVVVSSIVYLIKAIKDLKSVKIVLKAISLGFQSEEEMIAIQRLGYKTRNEYEKSFEKGFITKNEEISAKLLGVSTAADFIKIVNMFTSYVEYELKIRMMILQEIERSIDLAYELEEFEKIKEMIPLEFSETYNEFNDILLLMAEIQNDDLKLRVNNLLNEAKTVSIYPLNLCHKLNVSVEAIKKFKLELEKSFQEANKR